LAGYQQEEETMTFVAVTNWKTKSAGVDLDANWKRVQDQFVPALKALGATHVMGIQTSERESIMVVTYPDKSTRDAAHARIMEMRKSATTDMQLELTSEVAGEVKAYG
jgi:hypothetical protein